MTRYKKSRSFFKQTTKADNEISVGKIDDSDFYNSKVCVINENLKYTVDTPIPGSLRSNIRLRICYKNKFFIDKTFQNTNKGCILLEDVIKNLCNEKAIKKYFNL